MPCGLLKGMRVSVSVPDSCIILSREQREKKKKKNHGVITEDHIQTSVKGAITGGSLTWVLPSFVMAGSRMRSIVHNY